MSGVRSDVDWLESAGRIFMVDKMLTYRKSLADQRGYC